MIHMPRPQFLPLLFVFLHCITISFAILSTDPLHNADFASRPEHSVPIHRIDITLPDSDMQWVLLGVGRSCGVRIDSVMYRGLEVILQGNTNRIGVFPKKTYQIAFETAAGGRHDLVLFNSASDTSFLQQKLVHDMIRTLGGPSISIGYSELYINGHYNGLYVLKENIDQRFFDSRFGAAVDYWAVYGDDITLHANDTQIAEFDADNYSQSDFNEPFVRDLLALNPREHMNDTRLFAYSMAISLAEVLDIAYRNYYIAATRDNTGARLFDVVLWDADRLLGDGHRHSPYVYSLQRTSFPNGMNLLDGALPQYRAEFARQLADGGLLSLEALQRYVDEHSAVLRDAAARDAVKWADWYGNSVAFEDAVADLRRVLSERHAAFASLLAGETVPQGFYGEANKKELGEGSTAMFGLMYALLALNVLVMFFKACTPTDTEVSQEGAQPTGQTDVCGPAAQCEQPCPACLVKAAVTRMRRPSGSLRQRVQTVWARVGHHQRVNVLVVALVLAVYHVFAKYDVLDDSEILDSSYLAQIRHTWIYIPLIVNAVFLLPSPRIRLGVWVVLVLITNIWGLYDLFEYTNIKAETSSTIATSRETTISLDTSECLDEHSGAACNDLWATGMFVVWRVLSQVVVAVYSLRIPTIVRRLTEQSENGTPSKRKPASKVAPAPPSSHPTGDASSSESEVCSSGVGSPDIPRSQPSPPMPALDLNAHLKRARALPTDPEQGAVVADKPVTPEEQEKRREEAASAEKRRLRMGKFMNVNFAIFFAICLGGLLFLIIDGRIQKVVGDVAFSTITSLAILVNMRTLYACWKWLWLWLYGFDYHTLELMFGARKQDSGWDLQRLCRLPVTPRTQSVFLPGKGLSTEKKIRTADAWTKKFAHMYDGLLVFLISANSFSEGGDTLEVYTFAYTVSLFYIALYYLTLDSEGTWGWIVYGAKSRVMDGFLGRANEVFGFIFDKYMIPVSTPLLLWLNSMASDEDAVTLSFIIFMPIIVGDSMAELVGSTWGKQTIRVYGMGEINKKSWEGFWAMFWSSFLLCVGACIVRGVSWDWYLLSLVICAVDTVAELLSFRSTDNVTMMISGAVFAGAFAAIKQ